MHATSLTTSSFGLTPSPLSADVIYGCPLGKSARNGRGKGKTPRGEGTDGWVMGPLWVGEGGTFHCPHPFAHFEKNWHKLFSLPKKYFRYHREVWKHSFQVWGMVGWKNLAGMFYTVMHFQRMVMHVIRFIRRSWSFSTSVPMLNEFEVE